MTVDRPPRFTPAKIALALVVVTWSIAMLGPAPRAITISQLATVLCMSIVVAHTASRNPGAGLLGPAISMGALLGVVVGLVKAFSVDSEIGFGSRLVLSVLASVGTGIALAPTVVLLHLPIVLSVRAARATPSHASPDAVLVVGGAWCALLSLLRIPWALHGGRRAWAIEIVAPFVAALGAAAFGVARVRARARAIERVRRGEIEGLRIVDDVPHPPPGLPLLVAPKWGGAESLLVRAGTEQYRVDARPTPVARVPRAPIDAPVRDAIARHLRKVPIPRAHYVRLVVGSIVIASLFVVVWNFFTDVPHPVG